MSEAKYTPTPWRQEEGTTLVWGACGPDFPFTGNIGVPVAEAQLRRSWASEPNMDTALANAAFIVTAVNAHADLVEALRNLLEKHGHMKPCDPCPDRECEICGAFAALSKAGVA